MQFLLHYPTTDRLFLVQKSFFSLNLNLDVWVDPVFPSLADPQDWEFSAICQDFRASDTVGPAHLVQAPAAGFPAMRQLITGAILMELLLIRITDNVPKFDLRAQFCPENSAVLSHVSKRTSVKPGKSLACTSSSTRCVSIQGRLKSNYGFEIRCVAVEVRFRCSIGHSRDPYPTRSQGKSLAKLNFQRLTRGVHFCKEAVETITIHIPTKITSATTSGPSASFKSRTA